jgi:hypothetical protein
MGRLRNRQGFGKGRHEGPYNSRSHEETAGWPREEVGSYGVESKRIDPWAFQDRLVIFYFDAKNAPTLEGLDPRFPKIEDAGRGA